MRKAKNTKKRCRVGLCVFMVEANVKGKHKYSLCLPAEALA